MSVDFLQELGLLFENFDFELRIAGMEEQRLMSEIAGDELVCDQMISFFCYVEVGFNGIECEGSEHTKALKFLRKVFASEVFEGLHRIFGSKKS